MRTRAEAKAARTKPIEERPHEVVLGRGEIPATSAPRETLLLGRRQPGLTLEQLAAFILRTGASIHLRAGADGRFVAVAHLAQHTCASDATGPDLEQALTDVMRDLESP